MKASVSSPDHSVEPAVDAGRLLPRHCTGSPVVDLFNRTAKRGVDLALSLICLAPAVPLMLSIGVLVRLTSKGPAIFRQTRVGKGGKPFLMLKFRTMIVNAPDLRNSDNSTFNSDNDPRLTKAGRFLRETSLDELPQLVNVLRGDMSLVGPRPELPEGPVTYLPHQFARLDVRPGLTGWAAVHGRNNVPMDVRRNLDAWYAQNWTPALDARILWRTVILVLTRHGVHTGNANRPQRPFTE